MSVKRAVLVGALLWVFIFFEVSILMFGFNLGAANGASYYIPHYIASAILAIVACIIYFKGIGGIKEGFFAGIIFLITGVILDSIITIPLFTSKQYPAIIQAYSAFFLDPMLWTGMIEGFIIVVIFGALKKPAKNGDKLATKNPAEKNINLKESTTSFFSILFPLFLLPFLECALSAFALLG